MKTKKQKTKLTDKDKLYNAIENITEKQFYQFCGYWFGEEFLFDTLRDSIENVDNKTIKNGLNTIKNLK